jgi:hypothetical protein
VFEPRRAAFDATITTQAQIIAYIDDFKLLMILTLVALPLVLFFRKPSRGAGRDQAAPGRALRRRPARPIRRRHLGLDNLSSQILPAPPSCPAGGGVRWGGEGHLYRPAAARSRFSSSNRVSASSSPISVGQP